MENIRVKYNESSYILQEVNGLHKVIATEQTPDNSEDKINPIIKWDNKNVGPNFILNETILNATASYNDEELLGTYEYNPSYGTMLPADSQVVELNVKFIPSSEQYGNSTYYDKFNIVEKNITVRIFN